MFEPVDDSGTSSIDLPLIICLRVSLKALSVTATYTWKIFSLLYMVFKQASKLHSSNMSTCYEMLQEVITYYKYSYLSLHLVT